MKKMSPHEMALRSTGACILINNVSADSRHVTRQLIRDCEIDDEDIFSFKQKL
jgi:hypothetical protein